MVRSSSSRVCCLDVSFVCCASVGILYPPSLRWVRPCALCRDIVSCVVHRMIYLSGAVLVTPLFFWLSYQHLMRFLPFRSHPYMVQGCIHNWHRMVTFS